MTHKLLTTPLLLLLASGQISYAALYYPDLGTEETFTGSGVYQFIDGATTGWSGNGTITGPTGDGVSSSGSLTAVDNFTGSGTLSMGRTVGWGTSVTAGTTAEMTVSLTGTGSADVAFNHLTSGAPAFHPLGMHIRDFQGDVTEVIVEINFSNPLAPTATSAQNNQPFLAGIDTFTGWNTYNYDSEYLGLMHTLDGTTMQLGMPTDFESIDMNGNSTDWADGSTSITNATITNGSWRGLNTFDVDNDGIHGPRVSGDGIIQDGEDVYASGIRFTIRRNDGASLSTAGADSARFLFSTNGTIHSDTVALAAAPVVPEPSSILLSVLGLLALAKRNRQ